MKESLTNKSRKIYCDISFSISSFIFDRTSLLIIVPLASEITSKKILLNVVLYSRFVALSALDLNISDLKDDVYIWICNGR